MISEQDLILIQKAIKIYDKMVGKTYLLAYSSSKNQPLKVVEIAISEENFWHLLGCKAHKGNDQKELFKRCLDNENICQLLDYTRKSQDLKKKSEIFNRLFDFIENAKMLTLCNTDGLPEESMFQIGAGTVNGIIGYAKISNVHIPKTTQDKSVFALRSNANDRIFLIMSKKTESAKYDVLEYVSSPKYKDEIISKLPEEYLHRIQEESKST